MSFVDDNEISKKQKRSSDSFGTLFNDYNEQKRSSKIDEGPQTQVRTLRDKLHRGPANFIAPLYITQDYSKRQSP